MFVLTGNYTYYINQGINQGSTDMRCGIDKLSYIVRTKMRKDPCSGDVFIFMSKSRKVYRIIETRLVCEFEHIEKVVEHRYHILRCVDAAGKIVDVYVPCDKQDLRSAFECSGG